MLYGGSAGGGKSEFLLGDFLQDVPTYGEAWQGVIFRRTYRELEELLARSQQLYPPTAGKWQGDKDRWVWPTGATLRMRYLERDIDATRYQGHSYSWIGWDELGQWASPFAYRYLRGRLRSAKPVPTKRIRSTANPGGAGHQWVKAEFIDPAPGGYTPILDPVTGMERMFIPSRLRDNLILMAADPGYVGRLRGLGSPELVRAMLDGDWSVVTGAYFPEFDTAKHVIAPCPLPKHWTRIRAFDWGSARPFCNLWLAVSDGTAQFPANAIIVYREWYGSTGEPNVGLRMPAEAVGSGILAREDVGERIVSSICDPAMLKEDGGPSLAERMRGIPWYGADNSRVPGWDQLRARLIGIDDKPALYVFSACINLIRTLPALQHDTHKPEDLDSSGEDHAADGLRYGLMSRPWVAPAPAKDAPYDSWEATFKRQRDEGGDSWKVA
jgi:Terminase large subunit, T4likevirus-type, N-terminal